jgi:crotonobetainyl-CoA:carnitine CoA-transferase CaiB-like acyl-CoA transferase
MEQVFAHPQVQARGMQMELDHPLAGSVPQVASPIKYTGEALEYQGAPPTLGQHSDDVLSEVLDMSEDEIKTLRDAGVLGR